MISKLFNRKKKTPVDRISFENFDWYNRDKTSTLNSWVKEGQTAFVAVEYYNHPYKESNLDDVIIKIRDSAVNENNGGIIDCKIIQKDDYNISYSIIKEPQESSGMSYIGTFTIPYQDAQFIIMLKVFEVGITGMRESVKMNDWLGQNPEFESDETGRIIGWFEDPFDSSFKEGTPMNYSEKQEFDKLFPDHPLSQVRAKMEIILDSLTIE